MSGGDRRWGDVRSPLGADQLGPDPVPVVGAEIPERINGGHLRPLSCEGWAGRPDPANDLVGVLLIDRKCCGDGFSALRGVLNDGHA